MPIPDMAFSDVPELRGKVTHPENSRMRLSVSKLEKVDDLARSQGRIFPWRLSNEELEAGRQETLTGRLGRDLWVFGYGSLIWDPGLNVVELRRACVMGYRRQFCLTQTFDRGSIDHPGLMLAWISASPPSAATQLPCVFRPIIQMRKAGLSGVAR
jgi:cation transport protein ChaC